MMKNLNTHLTRQKHNEERQKKQRRKGVRLKENEKDNRDG